MYLDYDGDLHLSKTFNKMGEDLDSSPVPLENGRYRYNQKLNYNVTNVDEITEYEIIVSKKIDINW